MPTTTPRTRDIFLQKTISLLTAIGYRIEETSLPGGTIYKLFPPTGRPFTANIRSSAKREIHGVYDRAWGTYARVDRCIFATYRTAEDPASGIEVFSFPADEVVDRLKHKRGRSRSAGPFFVTIDGDNGIARSFPAIANDDALVSGFAREREEFIRKIAAEYSVPADRIRLHITLVGESVDMTIPLM